MFSGNFKGNMEVNEQRLHEIRHDIHRRQLASQLDDKPSRLGKLLNRIKQSSMQIQTDITPAETQPSQHLASS